MHVTGLRHDFSPVCGKVTGPVGLRKRAMATAPMTGGQVGPNVPPGLPDLPDPVGTPGQSLPLDPLDPDEAVAVRAAEPLTKPPCATCASQWWEQAVMQVISVVRKWHDIVDTEACAGYTAEDRARERKLLVDRMAALRCTLNSPPPGKAGDHQQELTSARVDSAQRRSEARRCAAVAASSAPEATRESLQTLFDRIESNLRDNRRAVEQLSAQHVGSGLRSVATVIDVAIYSARRVKAAVRSAERARDKACRAGREVLRGRRSTCRARLAYLARVSHVSAHHLGI